MIPKIETCEECGCKYKEGTSDYSSIFQTGYCGDCLVKRVERRRMVVPKFRAYNPANNKWYNSEEVFVCDGKIYLNDEDFEDLTQNNDVELMQSTGLFDKNGKEIFEGDVVRMHSGELLPVRFHHGMFESVCYYVSSVFEKVGNIFENPELTEHPDFREKTND